jgi:hypothetical protein
MGDINKALGQVRPILGLVGSIIIAVGILKFFGVQVPIRGSGLELAVAGFLIKAF